MLCYLELYRYYIDGTIKTINVCNGKHEVVFVEERTASQFGNLMVQILESVTPEMWGYTIVKKVDRVGVPARKEEK